MTVRLLIGYDGTNFAGFQVQPDQRTVQGTLEDALAKVAGESVRVRAAGRTDAGVHALGQVISFEHPELHPDVVFRAMPSLLPDDVAVVDAQAGPDGFDARRSALWRAYTYVVWAHEAPNPVFRRYATWMRSPLDVCGLAEALHEVIGTHDFTSFGRVRPDQTPVRTVLEANAVCDGPFVRIRVVGESFLHQMVRSIVGTALEIGTGRKPLSFMTDALAARDRAAAGSVAPPHGLALVDVGYESVAWPRRTPVAWPWSDLGWVRSERDCA